MSVTFTLVPHAANEFKSLASSTAEQLLQYTHGNNHSSIFSSSFGQGNQSQIVIGDHVCAQNGLVNTVLAAHNQHHALILRPDDIWLAIVTQFSFFVNKHAEQLRGRFVAHTGQKHIELSVSPSTLFDGGYLAKELAKELSKHVTDVGLRQWIVPEFSTTTETDRIVGCVILMGAMKKYFSYGALSSCGIPRVTLEGTRDDWEELVRRGDRLAEYGDECVPFHHMLMPVLRRFVATFDDSRFEKTETRQFWENMVQYMNPGSGRPYISGWLTAFCMLDEDGNWKGRTSLEPMMDGVGYPYVNIEDIPPAYVTVDIALDNDGDKHDAMILAGVATRCITSSGDTSLSSSGRNDTVSPGVAWWLFYKVGKEELARREEEKLKRWDAYAARFPHRGYTRKDMHPGFE